MPSAKSFAVLQSETSWGVVGTDVDRYLPLSSFGLAAEVDTREAKTNCGVLQPLHSEKVRRTVRGQIACPLYGAFAAGAAESFAQYLLQWAFASPETAERDSKSLRWIDDVSAAHWSGLRVDEATLAGDENGVTLTLSLAGKTELASSLATTLPTNRAKLLEFRFADVALTLDSVSLPIESFEWTISHGLAIKHNGYEPSSLKATGGKQTFKIKPLKIGDARAVLQRLQTMAISTATLTMTGDHAGTAANTHTRLSLAFAKLALVRVDGSAVADDYNIEPVEFRCLKTQNSVQAVAQTWDTI